MKNEEREREAGKLVSVAVKIIEKAINGPNMLIERKKQVQASSLNLT
jgi:hypothetical protein